MDRYFINWSYENVDKDEQGDFVYYSDVKDLETKLEQAQFTINQLDLALVLERERLAEAQADNMALVEALRKSLLLWKGWGNNNYAEDACYQSNLKVLEQPHPGDSLRKELEQLQKENAELCFTADTYFYLCEALKEMPEVLPQVLEKANSDEFKARFAKEVE